MRNLAMLLFFSIPVAGCSWTNDIVGAFDTSKQDHQQRAYINQKQVTQQLSQGGQIKGLDGMSNQADTVLRQPPKPKAAPTKPVQQAQLNPADGTTMVPMTVNEKKAYDIYLLRAAIIKKHASLSTFCPALGGCSEEAVRIQLNDEFKAYFDAGGTEKLGNIIEIQVIN